MALDASFETVAAVRSVEELAKLDILVVKGWEVLAPKGKYSVGDTVFYVRPDARITKRATWAGEEIRRYLGARGRVKTIRLRGYWSNGMLVDLEALPKEVVEGKIPKETLCDYLGIEHYSEPAPSDLSAKANYLPPGIEKSDEDNFQNLNEFPNEDGDPHWHLGEEVLVTKKMDGSSCTVYYDPDEDVFAVCSRSMWLKEECVNNYTTATKPYWDKIKELARYLKMPVAIRGEVCGNHINITKPNKDARGELGFYMYGTRFPKLPDLNERMGRWGTKYHFTEINKLFVELGFGPIPTVPILGVETVTREMLFKYKNAPAEDGEGIVVNGSTFSYKDKSDDYYSKLK